MRDDSLRLIKSTCVVNTPEKMKKYGVSFWKNEHDLEISCTFAVCILVSYVLRNDSLLFQTKANKDWLKICMRQIEFLSPTSLRKVEDAK